MPLSDVNLKHSERTTPSSVLFDNADLIRCPEHCHRLVLLISIHTAPENIFLSHDQ